MDEPQLPLVYVRPGQPFIVFVHQKWQIMNVPWELTVFELERTVWNKRTLFWSLNRKLPIRSARMLLICFFWRYNAPSTVRHGFFEPLIYSKCNKGIKPVLADSQTSQPSFTISYRISWVRVRELHAFWCIWYILEVQKLHDFLKKPYKIESIMPSENSY